jgi:hypothetical protein
LTWRNLLIEWRKKSDRFKCYGQPIAPAKLLVSPAKIVLKSMPEPVHIHPTISYNRPSPIAPYSALQPPPAKAFMTPEQLDKIFREETEAAPHDTIINIISGIVVKVGTADTQTLSCSTAHMLTKGGIRSTGTGGFVEVDSRTSRRRQRRSPQLPSDTRPSRSRCSSDISSWTPT